MKFHIISALSVASLVTARPDQLQRRQTTSNDLTRGACKGVVLVFARGTTEPGNVGMIVGGPLVAQLKKGLGGDLAVEGVNYAAGVATNLGPGGADPKGVSEAKRLFSLAATKCPNAIIIGGGYSQGAAIMHGAAKGLEASVESKIAGIALFGDTQNKQSGGHIKGFPEEKSKVFCIPGDGVCGGMLAVNAQHLAYVNNPMLKQGADWLLERISAAKSGGGQSSSSSGSDASASEGEASAGDMSGMEGMGGMGGMGGLKGGKGLGGLKGGGLKGGGFKGKGGPKLPKGKGLGGAGRKI